MAKTTPIVVSAETLPRLVRDIVDTSAGLYSLTHGTPIYIRPSLDSDHYFVVYLDRYQEKKLLERLPQRTLQREYGGG